jgi:lysozyme family protein
MPVHYRESDVDWQTYLGNGDPLDKATTHVPQGRGPFDTWEAGALDSLEYDATACRLTPHPTWALACYAWESWNGFGTREHGYASGYLWAGTDQYLGGEYDYDGHFSANKYDYRLGCVILAKAIVGLDPSLDFSVNSSSG